MPLHLAALVFYPTALRIIARHAARTAVVNVSFIFEIEVSPNHAALPFVLLDHSMFCDALIGDLLVKR